MKALLTLLFLALCLGGCTTTNQFEVAEYNQLLGDPFPAISIHPLHDIEFFSECQEYGEKSLLNFCSSYEDYTRKIYTEFFKVEQFDQVLYGGDTTNYELHIGIAESGQSGAGDLTKAVVSGASLLLVPVTQTTNIKVKASLRWQGIELKQFQYNLPFKQSISWLTLAQDRPADIAEMVTSHLVKDFQDTDAFNPKLLWSTLGASDYDKNLVLPDTIGEYLKTDTYQFEFPLLGMLYQYTHRNFPLDAIDTYIYPVRHWSYDDVDTALQRETLNIKDELATTLRSQEIDNLTFSETKTIRNIDSFKTILFLQGQYKTPQKKQIETYTYLGLQKDKLIKLRASIEYKDEHSTNLFVESLEDFAKNYFDTITVPDESLFMLKARKQWRKSQQ